MAAHTKGPWSVRSTGTLYHDLWVAQDGPKRRRADPIICSGISSENGADARLIAAAPETKKQRDDLLNALKKMSMAYEKLADIVGDSGPHWTIYREAKAAIAKAEGPLTGKPI